MILTRTPVRVSFFGGGSDYPAWYLKHGGMVVGGAIDKYVYVAARRLPPFHPFKTRVSYSEIETVWDNSLVKHRAVNSALAMLGVSEGLEITHMADVPGRTGMGTSSSFAVGLLHALSALKGQLLLPHALAERATRLERDLLGETVGSQDQAWAAHGGLAQIRFEQTGNVNVLPLPLRAADVRDLEAHLALFYTGQTRTASEVSAGYAPRLAQDASYQWAMHRLAEEGHSALLGRDWTAFGALMDKAWLLKRTLAGVSSPEIDRVYAAGRMSGASGGKLLGAGGGGCLLFVLKDPSHRDALWCVMNDMGLIEVPFRFEFAGSRVVYVGRETHDAGR